MAEPTETGFSIIESVLHPTDFSEGSLVAFHHALKAAMVARSKLTLLHVSPDRTAEWSDFPGVREVDRKLLELARATGGKLVTNDYALNRLADVNGIAVLNVNELAGSLRPVFLPGDAMQVHLVKEGKEAGQGVGYLDDGTMVVVDHGKRLIGQTVDAAVTTMLQTAAGRMIFARLRDEEPGPR